MQPVPTQADPDLPLVQQALRGDYSAFETLVNQYEKRSYAMALRIVRNDADAQDVVQTTMLAMLEKLDTFRQQSLFSSWLMRIATNEALVLLRKRRIRQMQPLGNADDDRIEPLAHPDFIAPWKHDPEEIASNRETRNLIDTALDELDEKYRLVFVLRDIEGFSTQETAQTLGISETNVKVRLLRARLMLRERLTRALGDESIAIRHTH